MEDDDDGQMQQALRYVWLRDHYAKAIAELVKDKGPVEALDGPADALDAMVDEARGV